MGKGYGWELRRGVEGGGEQGGRGRVLLWIPVEVGGELKQLICGVQRTEMRTKGHIQGFLSGLKGEREGVITRVCEGVRVSAVPG